MASSYKEKCPSCLFGNNHVGGCTRCGSRLATGLEDEEDVIFLSTRKSSQDTPAPADEDDMITCWMESKPATPKQGQKRSISLVHDVTDVDDEDGFIVWDERKPAAALGTVGSNPALARDNVTINEEDDIIAWEGKKPAAPLTTPRANRRNLSARRDDVIAWTEEQPTSRTVAAITPLPLTSISATPTASLISDHAFDIQTWAPTVLIPRKEEDGRNTDNTIQSSGTKSLTPRKEETNNRVAMRAVDVGQTKLTDINKELMAPQRNAFLSHVLPITKNAAQRWRVGYEKRHKNSSLWNMVVECAKALKCKEGRPWQEDSELEKLLSGTDGKLFCKNLQAYLDRPRFEALLKNIQPVSDSDVNGMDCPICCDRFQVSDIAFCNANHYLCRRCLCRYASETVQVGGLADIPCADPSCGAKFPTAAIEANLSEWDKLRMQEREDARNTKVALAAKAVLSCQCGAVGIIEENDAGDNRVECPGNDCSLVFCLECGNEWHDGTRCPAPKETVKWINKRTKPCPNCHTPIEKNGGCSHMHCAPPGGCGHRFTWGRML